MGGIVKALMGFLPQADILYVIGFAALAAFAVYERAHLINEGEHKVEAADKAAREDERAKIQAEQTALNQKANVAEAKANATQASFDDYMRNHPVASIGVHFCAANDSGPRLSGDAAPNGGNEVPGTGSDSVHKVSERSLDGAVDTILRASGRLATLYQQYQQQPEIKGTSDAKR